MMDDGGGGVQSQGVNPDCPNAANPFHRCAAYCPVPAPAPTKAAAAAVRSKPSPPRPRAAAVAAQNGTAKHGDGAARVAPASDAEDDDDDGGEREESRAVNSGYPASPPRPGPRPTHAAQNGTARRDEVEEECEITVVDESEEHGESVEDHGGQEQEQEVSGGGRTRASARSPATDDGGEAGGETPRQQAVNPDCPNAANPFHRCAEYCPVPVPVPKAPPLPRPRGYEGSTHSDPGELHPRPRRRDKGGGSGGGLPLYVFRKRPPKESRISSSREREFRSLLKLKRKEKKKWVPLSLSPSLAVREGSDGDGKKVDPRCPNAPNPFHVCTDHCLAKIAEAGRSSEGAKSPISLFSRHSRRSSSSSEGCCCC
jgi:hypothetical protein